jgi:hypothetical protein
MTLTEFFKKTFCDATGQPDGKLLTIAGVALIVICAFPVGWIFQRWPPEYIWSPTLLFLAAGLGIDAYVTHAKIRADAGPETVVEQSGKVTNNLNGPDGQS